MLTKGAIGNLINRYKAVLAKCNLINTFGSLAVAAALVLGGTGVAGAGIYYNDGKTYTFSDSSYSNGTNSYCAYTQGKNGGYGGSGSQLIFDKPNNSSIVTFDTNYNEGHAFGIAAQWNNASITISEEIDEVYITSIGSTGSYGVYAASNSDFKTKVGTVNLNAKKTIINSSCTNGVSDGIVVYSWSYVNVTGDLELTADNAIQVRCEGHVNINESGNNNIVINGDILYDYGYSEQAHNKNLVGAVNGYVNITLNDKDSYWNGNSYLKWYSNITKDASKYIDGLNIYIKDNARWIPTLIEEYSEPYTKIIKNKDGSTTTEDHTRGQKLVGINNLTMEDGIIEIHENVTAKADVLSGSGGEILVEDANKLGSFIASDVATTTELNVQAIDKDGNVKNADQISAARLAELQKQVKTVDENGTEVALETTASAGDGIANNGFTITTDENGAPVVTGGGASDVTKAVLQQASVTTVALDKILTNDVRKRLGDIRSDKNQTGVWMRWDGGKMKGDSGLTNNFNTIQIGGDTKAAKNCRIGFAGSFTHGDTDFNRGNGELEGFSFALYGTWMGENGMFADVVARLGKFSTEMNVEGKEGDMDNRVASLSAEYGWRLPVCNQFFVEPQVELAYTYVSSDDLQLGDVKFAFDNVDSLTGRVGAVFGWNLPEERGNVYARASVVQQFMGDAKVTAYTNADPVVHETDGDDTWLEYGIGANVKLTDSTYVWADVERTEGADIEEEWRGTVGVRFSF